MQTNQTNIPEEIRSQLLEHFKYEMTPDEIRAELWEQYQHEMKNGYGFGHTSKWGKGQRNFVAFCKQLLNSNP